MTAEPNLSGAIDRLSAAANRIADDRNAYLKAARAMLATLEGVRNWIGRDVPIGTISATHVLGTVNAAIAAAKAAGIKA